MRSRYRLSIDTITIRNATLEEKFSLAASVGFQGIELWGAEIDDDDATLAHASELARAHNLVIEGVCPQPDLYTWHAEWTVMLEDKFRHRLARYAHIGAGYVALPVMSDAGDLSITADSLGYLGEIANETGIGLGLEPIGHVSKLSRIEDAFAIISDYSGAARVGVILDVFHFFRGRNDLHVLREQDPEAIIAVHIDDAMDLAIDELVGYRHRLYPGHGIFDVAAFCRTLDEMGYNGPFIVELLNETYWQDDPADVVQRAYDSTRPFLAPWDENTKRSLTSDDG